MKKYKDYVAEEDYNKMMKINRKYRISKDTNIIKEFFEWKDIKKTDPKFFPTTVVVDLFEIYARDYWSWYFVHDGRLRMKYMKMSPEEIKKDANQIGILTEGKTTDDIISSLMFYDISAALFLKDQKERLGYEAPKKKHVVLRDIPKSVKTKGTKSTKSAKTKTVRTTRKKANSPPKKSVKTAKTTKTAKKSSGSDSPPKKLSTSTKTTKSVKTAKTKKSTKSAKPTKTAKSTKTISEMTVKELLQYCKDKGITGCSGKKKNDIIIHILKS